MTLKDRLIIRGIWLGAAMIALSAFGIALAVSGEVSDRAPTQEAKRGNRMGQSSRPLRSPAGSVVRVE